MIERITFDVAGNPEMPSLILMTKGQKNIGEITNFTAFHASPHMNAIDEISFVLHKFENNESDSVKQYKYWDEVKDFRVIYAPEWKQYFEISVSLDDKNDVTKTVRGTALQETELSLTITK